MALRIVDVALEVAGPSIASHPSLANLAKDTLCRHLFQLVRSDNMAILNESLRVAGTLLATCRKVLKLQQELYLSYLIACLFPKVEIPAEPGIDPSLYAGVPRAMAVDEQHQSRLKTADSLVWRVEPENRTPAKQWSKTSVP
jgi:brefeldin A-resistance guanine nucleotide exchange factor 1